MEPLPPEAFEDLVEEAFDLIPQALLDGMDNVAVVVQDADPDEPDLLGLYVGVPLPERGDAAGLLPDRIAIYRLPLCAWCDDLDQLRDEIAITLVHELAHHLGIDDDALHLLGWA